MLKYNEFVPYATDRVGVVRINHASDACSGRSKSLRIERKHDGTITAKCFRCGEFGLHNDAKGSLAFLREYVKEGASPPKDDKRKGKGLGRIIESPSGWPVLAYQWVKQYGISDEEIARYVLQYSDTRRRVVLPVWWKGERVGYQLRKVYADDDGPKYDTVLSGGLGFMSFKDVTNNAVVIVEDILSAIKVSRFEHSVALLSTSLSQNMVQYLSTFSKFYVWLDMDNNQVIKNALKILKRLDMFGETKLIRTEQDPKTYCNDVIRSQLHDA